MITGIMDMLYRHEGLRLKPYRDTVGKLTIGVGRNLDDKGITEQEATYLLRHDIDETWNALGKIPAFKSLSRQRQAALVDMAFNLGIAGLMGFKRMWAALEAGDFETAAAEMLDSKWAKQVGDQPPSAKHPYGQRAWELAQIMRTGSPVNPEETYR